MSRVIQNLIKTSAVIVSSRITHKRGCEFEGFIEIRIFNCDLTSCRGKIRIEEYIHPLQMDSFTKYKIIRRIGGGSFVQCLLAEHPDFGECALLVSQSEREMWHR